ncbi:transcriptional regulator [Micromonospora sp. NBC_01813]|uniref:transcriptional regulator n=1 Tax=Micromonospora sp. NBC_01813 TaxID=2975988 RepID=UPI002DD81889|nr:transcriptional regulator [Micromonospora sp. NBC_01813]WSA11019.1 transcriptional regulator [Micromonospora sp. NBC_01813]
MQAEHTTVGAWHASARIRAAADGLDPHRVATLIAQRIADEGVVATWQRICLPLLERAVGESGPDIAVEHALSEGIRIGLDWADRAGLAGGRRLAPSGALLAAAEGEQHSLALHALAAGLRERGRDCLLLGAALPWSALTDAVGRWQPRATVIWAQTSFTARTRPLARLGRDFPSVRRCVAGPGWPPLLPPRVTRVDSLPSALRLVLSAD